MHTSSNQRTRTPPHTPAHTSAHTSALAQITSDDLPFPAAAAPGTALWGDEPALSRRPTVATPPPADVRAPQGFMPVLAQSSTTSLAQSSPKPPGRRGLMAPKGGWVGWWGVGAAVNVRWVCVTRVRAYAFAAVAID